MSPQAIVLGRNVDPTAPAATGERLVLRDYGGEVALKTTFDSPFGGTLRIRNTSELIPASYSVSTKDGFLLESIQTLPDGLVRRFGVPAGRQELALASASGVCIAEMKWEPAVRTVISDFVREAWGETGLEFAVGDQTLVVTSSGASIPALNIQMRAATPAHLSTTLQGSGELTFTWAMRRRPELSAIPEVETKFARFFTDGGATPSARVFSHEEYVVKMAFPSGTHPIYWEMTSSDHIMELKNLKWTPLAVPTVPQDGLLSLAQREGGQVWWTVAPDVARPVQLSAWDTTAEGRKPMTLQVQGPGIFVSEGRLKMSHTSAHYRYQQGMPELVIQNDRGSTLRLQPSDTLLPICIPLGAGLNTLTISVSGTYGRLLPDLQDAEGNSVGRLEPVTLTMTGGQVLPEVAPERMESPGISWDPTETIEAKGTMLTTTSGPQTLWNLTQKADAQLLATVTGPGILHWHTGDSGLEIKAFNGPARPMAVALIETYLGLRGFTHQLMVPPGRHDVLWRFNSNGPINTSIALRVHWQSDPAPALLLAAGLPTDRMYHFQSDGGWLPIPHSSAVGHSSRLITRYPGPATITLPTPKPNIAQRIMGSNVLPFTDANPTVEFSLRFANTLNFWVGGGEWGNLIEPYPHIKVSQIGQTSALVDETFEQWATRMELHRTAATAAADPDGDGLANLVECALGLHPRLANARINEILPPTPAQPMPTVLYPWPAVIPAAITRQLEVSTDLRTWVPIMAPVTEETVTVTLIAPTRFTRVRVSLVP